MNETQNLTHDRNKHDAGTEVSSGGESTAEACRSAKLDSSEGGEEVADAGRRMLNLHRGTISGPSTIDREGSQNAPAPASSPTNDRGQLPRAPLSASGRSPQHDEDIRQQEFSGRSLRDEPVEDRQQLLALDVAHADCDDGEDEDDDDEEDEEEDDDGTMSKRKARPRRWTDDEDTALCKGVEKYGERRWKLIAAGVGTRDHMQCLQRWKKVLKRGLVKTQWMTHEDAILRHELETHMYKHGDSSSIDWAAVAGKLPLRSVKECRERWKYSLSSLAVQWMQNSYTPSGAVGAAPAQADGRHSHLYGDGLQPQLVRPPPRVPTAQQSQPPLSRADMVSIRHSQAPRPIVGGESAMNGLSPSPGARPGQPPAPHQGVGLDAGPIEASQYAAPHGVPSSQHSPPTPQVHARFVPAVPQLPAWQPPENVGDVIQQRLSNVQRVMETAMREVTTLCQIVSSRNEPRSVGDRESHTGHGTASDGVQTQQRLSPHSSGDQPQAGPQALGSQLPSQQQSRQKDMQNQEQQQQARQPPQSRPQPPLLHSGGDGLPLSQHLSWVPGNYSGSMPAGLPPGNQHHATYMADQNHSASYGRYSTPPYSHFGASPMDNSGYYDRQI